MTVMRAVVAGLLAAFSAGAVTVGDTAPDFSLAVYGGGTFDLSAQDGKVTVLLFMGCT